MRSININWRNSQQKFNRPIRAANSDRNGRKLVVKISNVEEDAKLELHWLTNGYRGVDDFKNLGNGIYEVYYSKEMLSHIGKVRAFLYLKDSEGNLTSEPITIQVFKGAPAEGIEEREQDVTEDNSNDEENTVLRTRILELEEKNQKLVNDLELASKESLELEGENQKLVNELEIATEKHLELVEENQSLVNELETASEESLKQQSEWSKRNNELRDEVKVLRDKIDSLQEKEITFTQDDFRKLTFEDDSYRSEFGEIEFFVLDLPLGYKRVSVEDTSNQAYRDVQLTINSIELKEVNTLEELFELETNLDPSNVKSETIHAFGANDHLDDDYKVDVVDYRVAHIEPEEHYSIIYEDRGEGDIDFILTLRK